jgi:ankyrin repeat protein
VPEYYKMYLISVPDLLKLERLLPHQQMKAKGLLHEWTEEMDDKKVLFVSHEWLAWDQPDPEAEQLRVLQNVLRRLQDGKTGTVETHYLHQLQRYNKSMTAAECAAMVPNMMVWIDYLSIPQAMGSVATDEETKHQKAAIDSIPSYVSKCSMVVVLVPSCVHKDTGINTGFSSWRTRGWCRVEMAAAFLATSEIPLLVVRGLEFAPYFLSSLDTLQLPPGKGTYTCCQRGHKVNGVTIACDKVKIRPVVDQMLGAKVKHLFKCGDCTAARHAEAIREPVWLAGLPNDSAATGASSAQQQETDNAALDRLEKRLRWAAADLFALCPPEDDSDNFSTSDDDPEAWPLLCYAAMAGDATSIRELLRKGADVNASVPTDCPSLMIPKALTPLMCAMAFAPFNIVKILLDAGADPHAKVGGRCSMAGNGVLQWACAVGNEENVREWLVQFPSWNLEQKDVMGWSPLHWAAGTGVGRASMVRVLLDAGADIKAENHLGCSALAYLAIKDDEDLEAAQLLIDRGAKVNHQQKPNAMKWRLTMATVRGSVKCGNRSALFQEMATWNGSSALHFAAKQGHVRLVRLLLSAGADPELRNAQKMTPLDLARAAFGKNFTAMEAVFAARAGRAGGWVREQFAEAGPNPKGQSRALERLRIGRRAARAGG